VRPDDTRKSDLAMHRPTRRPLSRLVGVTLLVAATSWIGLPTSVAAADAPGACSTGIATSAAGAWLTDTIGSPTDVDWFKFTIATGTRAQVTLGNLPADYDLRVYSGCSTLVGASTRPARQYDEVYAFFGAGTYLVKVTGFQGAQSASPYSLRFRTLTWGIPILSSTTWTDASGYLHIAGEVLNNTAESRKWIEIDATLLNSSGGTVGSSVGYPDAAALAPGTRSPFEMVVRQPAGYARAALRVCTPSSTGGCLPGVVTSVPTYGLSETASSSFLDASGRRHYPGAIRNARTATAALVTAHITAYDAFGNVRGLGWDLANPSTLAPGTSGAYEVVGVGSASPNRYVTTTSGGTAACASAPRYTGAQENIVPPITRSTSSGRVALTFDMGGRMTPAVQILNILVANGVCATIFPTGAISQTAQGQAALAIVKAHPELFELGNHTMHHCDLVRAGGGAPGAAEAAFCAALPVPPTEAQVKKELTDAEAIIEQATGMVVQPFWRAPYGVSNLTVRTWAAEVGYTKHLKWDIDTIDWRPISDGGPTARSMALKVVNGATSGSVVLMHLGGFETPDALPAMIDGLRSRGFVLTTASDLLR
jgi:peptidoglycan/xylan/chitin deacetylase (PgdA/CDA1 family)